MIDLDKINFECKDCLHRAGTLSSQGSAINCRKKHWLNREGLFARITWPTTKLWGCEDRKTIHSIPPLNPASDKEIAEAFPEEEVSESHIQLPKSCLFCQQLQKCEDVSKDYFKCGLGKWAGEVENTEASELFRANAFKCLSFVPPIPHQPTRKVSLDKYNEGIEEFREEAALKKEEEGKETTITFSGDEIPLVQDCEDPTQPQIGTHKPLKVSNKKILARKADMEPPSHVGMSMPCVTESWKAKPIDADCECSCCTQHTGELPWKCNLGFWKSKKSFQKFHDGKGSEEVCAFYQSANITTEVLAKIRDTAKEKPRDAVEEYKEEHEAFLKDAEEKLKTKPANLTPLSEILDQEKAIRERKGPFSFPCVTPNLKTPREKKLTALEHHLDELLPLYLTEEDCIEAVVKTLLQSTQRRHKNNTIERIKKTLQK